MFGTPGATPFKMPLKGTALTKDKYRFVIFGHTHDDLSKDLPGLGVAYFNTGSWTVSLTADNDNVSRLCYVIVRRDVAGSVLAEQRLWPLS
jgi:predicted phosphodiesterase